MTNETENTPVQAEEGPRSPPPQPEAAQNQSPDERKSRPLPDDALIVLPVRNVVLFPASCSDHHRTEPLARAAQYAVRAQRPVGVLLQKRPEVDEPGPDDLHWVGTTANILRYVTGPDGGHHIVSQGEQRFRGAPVPGGMGFPRRARAAHRGARGDRSRDRGARIEPQQRAVEILRLLPRSPRT